jgi:hypothetical protein
MLEVKNPTGDYSLAGDLLRGVQPIADRTNVAEEQHVSWRDLVSVHEAANIFPMMSDVELDELGRDITRNGLRLGVVYWAPRPRVSKKGPAPVFQLLDGRNRLEAASRVIPEPEERADLADVMLNGDGSRVTVTAQDGELTLRIAKPVYVYGERPAARSALRHGEGAQP